MYSAMLLTASWMTAAVAAPEAPVVASVAYTYFTPAFNPPPLKLGDECFVPYAMASRLGWTCSATEGHAMVEADGRKVETFIRDLSGTRYLPLRSVVASLGGVSEWDGSNLKVYSKITSIKATDAGVEVIGSLPLKQTVFTVDKPFRVVMDLAGSRLDPTNPPVVSGPARFSQFSAGIVRVVVQLDANPSLSAAAAAGGLTSFASWKGAKSVPLEGGVADTAPKLPVETTPKPLPPGSPVASKPLLEKDTAKETLIRVPFTVAAPKSAFLKRDKTGVYWVNLPSAARGPDTDAEFTGQVLKSASLTDNPTGGVSLKMELKRPMGVKVSTSGSDLLVRIVEPKNGFGTLGSKTIVVDAGHGGTDSGARFTGGGKSFNEKDITLPIARLVAEKLSTAGSTVLMTRDDDTFIPLPNRPQVANDSSADFFVSVHINSNGVDGSRSGTYTYYHFEDPDCKLLAECIQAEVAKVTGLPDNGVASDRTVAKTKGFAVLRGSQMPAVLVEVGYINHATDRALLMSDEFRRKVADAIVRGIRNYIGDGQD